jgi:hypothetical protein
VVLLVLALLGALVLVFAFQAARTALALRQARTEAAQLRQALASDDNIGARRTLRDLTSHASTAHDSTDGVLWGAAAHLPLLGDDVAAVRGMSSALDTLSRGALPGGLDLVSDLRGGRLRADDGRFDVQAIKDLAPEISKIAIATAAAHRELKPIDPDALVGPVGKAASDLQKQVGSLDSGVRSASSVTKLLPNMLGADGPRSYLLVVQNNAEIRSTGGLPGSLSFLRARNGKIDFGLRGSARDFPLQRQPVLPLSAGEKAIYGKATGTDVRNFNLTPDFPRTGELFEAIVAIQRKHDLDGVISVDPITLAHVLRVTGPIPAGKDTFTADNVVPKLLHDVYQRLPSPTAQDAYFASASRSIADSLLSGPADQQNLVRALGEAARQRRVLVWSSDADEQRLLRGTAVSGELPRDTGSVPHVGMYLNDDSQGKMDYFLDYRGGVKSVRCTAKGTQTISTGMTLVSKVTSEQVGELTPDVTGPIPRSPRGDIRLYLHLYAPTDGKLTGLTVDGKRVRVAVAQHDGRQVSVLTLVVKPGEQIAVDATFRTRRGQDGDPVLDFTPGMRWQPSGATAATTCR